MLATGCDVEWSFSSLKWMKEKRQHGMFEETHISMLLLHCSTSTVLYPHIANMIMKVLCSFFASASKVGDNESSVGVLCLCVQGRR